MSLKHCVVCGRRLHGGHHQCPRSVLSLCLDAIPPKLLRRLRKFRLIPEEYEEAC
jgi:hypothetical protein